MQARHILIIEADAQIRRLLECWLAEAGHQIAPEQGPSGRYRDVDLVIADLGSAQQDFSSRVNALRQAHHAPLLLISARFRRGLEGSLHTAGRFGAQAVLPTPFNRDELLTAVDTAFAG